MNSRALRRLAADHGALHSQSLPPNYLFPPSNASDSDDLTQLDILLAGPTHTPFADGVFKLHLNIPTNYPQQPPTAHFRTPIFHPNVDPQTGGVCVETLKRDWDAKLTLRDILVVIGCLLIQPNPDSALNAEAGALIQNDYEAYTRRAQLMTSIHAVVSKGMREAVREAQNRGQIVEEEKEVEKKVDVRDFATAVAEPPPQRRRLGMTARQRGAAAVSRRGIGSEGSPSGSGASNSRRQQQQQQQQQPAPNHPFVVQTSNDDVFGDAEIPVRSSRDNANKSFDHNDYDSSMSMTDADQENDEARSPVKVTRTPKATAATPIRRPHGTPVPLGELVMDDPEPQTHPSSPSSSDFSDLDAEYPPSPSKSPMKQSPQKKPRNHNHHADLFPQHQQQHSRPESSRDALSRAAAFDLTPPNIFQNPLAQSSPYAAPTSPMKITDETPSPRKAKAGRTQQHDNFTPGDKPTSKFGALFATPSATAGSAGSGGVFKSRSPPSSSEKQKMEKERREELDARLWRLCGGDVGRWNRGEFEGDPFKVKAGRW